MLIVFAGAAVQRVAGVGFALMVAPCLVLLVGPVEGILLANLLGLVVCCIVLTVVWRDVDRRKALLLLPAGLVGVLPGVYTAGHLPSGQLQVTIGTIILVGLAGTLASRRLRLTPDPPTTLGSGLASGFMTATAGLGGPALTFYAVTTAWEQRRFAATAQISFAGQATLALGLKGFAHFPGPAQSVALVVAIVAGLWLGQRIAGRVPANRARTVAIVIALAGAVTTTIRGALTWAA